MKYFAICSGPEYAMLPVFFSISTELSDYKRCAEGLLDTFTRALETSGSLETRLRSEVQKWKLSRLSAGGASFGRQGTELFLSSGMAILKHALHDAWRQFIRPAQLKRLEHEKFRSDLAKVTEREAQLLKEVASSENDEISPSELSNPHDRNYFKRLTEKALLLHVGRGRYKLYHRLFREFLRQTQSTRPTAKAKTFAPGRGGKLAAASRSSLHYPQGGLHSLAPSIPYPFPHSHLLLLPTFVFCTVVKTQLKPNRNEKAKERPTVEAMWKVSICLRHAQTRRQNQGSRKEGSVWPVVLDNHLNL